MNRLPRLSAGRIVLGVTLLFVTYFVVAAGAAAVHREHQNDERDRLQAEIDEMESRYARLEALEQYLNSDEYIEEIAREQLGLVKQGETAIIAISTQPSPTPGPEPDLWWEVLIR